MVGIRDVHTPPTILRFRATIDLVRPERLDRTVKLTGLDYIDVPVLGKKDYRLNFYAHKEGSFVAKVSQPALLDGWGELDLLPSPPLPSPPLPSPPLPLSGDLPQ